MRPIRHPNNHESVSIEHKKLGLKQKMVREVQTQLMWQSKHLNKIHIKKV